MTKKRKCYAKIFVFLKFLRFTQYARVVFVQKNGSAVMTDPLKIFLFKKALNDDFFCFFFVHTEGHKLDELVIIDSADSRLVNNLRIR